MKLTSTSELTKAGLARAVARGKRLGGNQRRVVFDMVVARRLVLRDSVSVRKLARALGVSKTTAAGVKRAILTPPED